MTFLDSVNITEATITIKDFVTYSVMIAGFVSGYVGLRISIKNMNEKLTLHEIGDTKIHDHMDKQFENHKKKVEEDLMAASHGRNSIRKEIKEEYDLKIREMKAENEKVVQTLHQRIDRVRDDNIKSYEKLEKKIDDLIKDQDQNAQTILNAINSIRK